MEKPSSDKVLRMKFRAQSGDLIQIGTGLKLVNDPSRIQDYKTALQLYKTYTSKKPHVENEPSPAPHAKLPYQNNVLFGVQNRMNIDDRNQYGDIDECIEAFGKRFNIHPAIAIATILSAFPLAKLGEIGLSVYPSTEIAGKMAQLDIRKGATFETAVKEKLKDLGRPTEIVYTHLWNHLQNAALPYTMDGRGVVDIESVKPKYIEKFAAKCQMSEDQVKNVLQYAEAEVIKQHQVEHDVLATTFKDPKNQAFSIKAGFVTQDGANNDIGVDMDSRIERTFYVDHGKLAVKHDSFVLDVDSRGKGYAKKLMQNSLKLYDKMGIQKITTMANVDMGAYAWARYGFLPTDTAWKNMSAKLKPYMEQLPDDVHKLVTKLLASSDKKAMWAIADIPEWGKALLMNDGISWDAELDMSRNSPSRKRLENYIQ